MTGFMVKTIIFLILFALIVGLRILMKYDEKE